MILILAFSKSICIMNSWPNGISAGNSNQTRFRFWSGVNQPLIPWIINWGLEKEVSQPSATQQAVIATGRELQIAP